MFTLKAPKKGTKGKGITFTVPEYLKNTALQKLVILFLLAFILTVILFPQILAKTPHYSIGSIAAADIKADRDFLIEDEASTEQKRLEAAKNAKYVYDYDVDMPSKIGVSLSEAFLIMEDAYKRIDGDDKNELSHEAKQDILQDARKNFEDNAGIQLTDKEYSILDRHKFDFAICNDIVSLIYAVYKKGLFANEDFLNLHKEKGIIVHDIKTQNEEDLRDLSSVINSQEVKDLITNEAQAILENQDRNIKNVLVTMAERIIRPNLTFAKNATEERKRAEIENIKPVFYKVQKDEMIVREGEKITPAELDKLEILFNGQQQNAFLNISIFIGMFLTITFFALVLYHACGKWLQPHDDNSLNDILLLCTTLIIQMLLVRAGIFTCEAVNRAFPHIPTFSCFYALPFIVGTMLIAILLNKEAGFVFSLFSSFLITFLFEDKNPIFLYALIGGFIASYHIIHCKQRSAFFKTGLIVGGSNMIIILCLAFLKGEIHTFDTAITLVMGVVSGLLSGILVSGIVPLMELLFGYTTDIRLLELANLNNPVFQQLIMVAPGTYHHSIIVGSMVEAAAEAIHANSLLAKVSAYYHDIGKIKKSLYFIENQQKWENKHDKLSPKMSSLVIISHVKDGCDLARKYRLGKDIMDIIRQHHGTRLAGYFYEKARKDKDPSIRSIPESDFRYPGPKPQSKEAALVLLGDVVEASSRALNDPTPSRIRNLVEERIREVVNEGQLDECDLTFHDLSKISESFIRILTGIFHRRIAYTDTANKEKESPDKKEKDAIYRKSAEKNPHRHLESAAGS